MHTPGSDESTPTAAGELSEAQPAVPNYDLLKLLGRGGFGCVWLGRHRLTGVHRAIKTIPVRASVRFELEAIRLYKQRAAEHPHLARIEHVGEADLFYYYVMELADDARGRGLQDPGGYEPMTLSEHIARFGASTTADSIDIALDLLDALENIHRTGLLHRDVKPANVLRCSDLWKLGDVGLVTDHKRTDAHVGTPLYSAPEGVVDRSGDLFCLGMLLSELSTGSRPRKPGDPPSLARRHAGRAERHLDKVIRHGPWAALSSARSVRISPVNPRPISLHAVSRSSGAYRCYKVYCFHASFPARPQLPATTCWVDLEELSANRTRDGHEITPPGIGEKLPRERLRTLGNSFPP